MKINETIIPIVDQGIFQVLNNLGKFEWMDEEFTKSLDIEYYLNHSGEKSLSPMYEKIIAIWNNGKGTEFLRKIIDDDMIRTQEDSINVTIKDRCKINPLSAMASIVYYQFHDKWNKLYDAYVATTYNPIENYAMEETETSSGSGETSTASEVKTTQASQGSSSSTGDNDVYGFNSTDKVHDTASDATASASNSGTSTTSQDADKNKVSDSRSDSRTMKRSGNIGVTTSQKMLQSEINLRQYDFIEQLFKDVDKILTKPMYNF